KTLPPLDEETRDLARMILHVPGHNHGGFAGGKLQASGGAGMASVVAAQPHYLHARVGAIDISQYGERVLRAAILDEKKLPIERPFRLGHRGERLMHRAHVVAFVEDRNNDGTHHMLVVATVSPHGRSGSKNSDWPR